MDWMFVPHPHSSVVTLTPNMTEFGDRAFVEVTQVKRGHEGGALALRD